MGGRCGEVGGRCGEAGGRELRFVRGQGAWGQSLLALSGFILLRGLVFGMIGGSR